MENYPILSIILFSPIVGALVVLCIPGKLDQLIKWTALAFASVSLLLSTLIFIFFNRHTASMQFTEWGPWVSSLGISYSLGVDGLSMPMVLLTAIILFCGILVSWKITERTKEFFFYMLFLIGGVFGVFMARDLFLLFFFLEIAVIPKFILINIWGSKIKEYAAMKYTLYLLAGSALALIGIIALYNFGADPVHGLGYTFDIEKLATVKFDPEFQKWGFLLFLIGFGVLVPIFPLHRWTPDGHSAAPTAISMILAGVIMKLGGYALIRLAIVFFPEGAHFWSPLIATLATVNIVYIALVALVQKDIKYVVANSSISHMGFVLIAVASLNATALDGAAAQMFAHGIMAALLFALVGNVYDKAHTREIADFGGLAHQMPRAAALFLIGGLASLGLPGTFNFVAEFSILTGAIQAYPIQTVVSILSVVITAIYILNVAHRIFFGPKNPKWDGLKDIRGMETLPFIILAGVLIGFGILPDILMGMVDKSVAGIALKFSSLVTGR